MRKCSSIPLAVYAALLFAVGCNELKPTPRPGAHASSSASVAASAPTTPAPLRVPRQTQPAPKAQEVTFKADGVRLVGSLWADKDPTAPAVILVHRIAGNRGEWTPLVERLLPSKHPMHVLSWDLRGHGESASKKVAWQVFKQDEWAALVGDVTAAMELMRKRKGGPPRGFVLVGSDIGATLALMAASKAPEQVRAVALVSPGVRLRGLDLYEPFGALVAKPNLVLAATTDNVSRDPARLLPSMSKSTKTLRYEASAHGAEALGLARWEMWDDLAEWVEGQVAPAEQSTPSALSLPSPGASSPKKGPAR